MGVFSYDPDFYFARRLALTRAGIHFNKTNFKPGDWMLLNNSYHDDLPYAESYYHQRCDAAFTSTETE